MHYMRLFRIRFVFACILLLASAVALPSDDQRVIVQSDGWNLVGDFRNPESATPIPAVLMLNKAAGDRSVYEPLASALASRGIASLRLDLRGHGESTNLAEFKPDEASDEDREFLIWNSDTDVAAAHRYLAKLPGIDPSRIGIVGGSYSGEEMAEAGRKTGYAAAYVALSPGSFSDESIINMDSSGVPWLFIASRNEPFLTEISAEVQATTETVEIIYLPGIAHATRILEGRPDLNERIAIWLSTVLAD